MESEEYGLVGRIGPLEIDWPRTAGYFGGIAAAIRFGLVSPPLGAVIAFAPVARMLDVPGTARARRFVGQVLEGVVKPIGGEDEGTIRITQNGRKSPGGGSRRSTSNGASRHPRKPAIRASARNRRAAR